MSSVTRLKPFRTTAFKLAAGYLVVFGVFALGLIGYLVWETSSVLVRDVDRRLNAEARRLGQHYQQGGINQLFAAMQESAQRPGNRIYALLTPDGTEIVNSLGVLPEEVWDETGLARFAYEQVGPDGSERDSRAIVRVIALPDGFRALIGFDIGQTDVIRNAIQRAALVSMVLLLALGLLGWLYVNKRVLKRIDGISHSTARIMDGHLSERIAVMGTGDEFDRLADQLNVMLARLERLMNGLKEVSDNIAHDLRTPLTRMRNQMEDALRQPPGEETDRAALESALGEAEHLMATFQALLTIARVEAGGRRHTLSHVDLGQVLTDVVELYEPVAEDQDVSVVFTAPAQPVSAQVNRELLGLAVANLVDNALKYGRQGGGTITLALTADERDVAISVADNGPGIPVDERERVKGRFVRLEKSRTAEGSGLGLALVDAVAAFHDGALELNDAQPGLKATLRIPFGSGEVSS
jgi:signal transduction histidine kinase